MACLARNEMVEATYCMNGLVQVVYFAPMFRGPKGGSIGPASKRSFELAPNPVCTSTFTYT